MAAEKKSDAKEQPQEEPVERAEDSAEDEVSAQAEAEQKAEAEQQTVDPGEAVPEKAEKKPRRSRAKRVPAKAEEASPEPEEVEPEEVEPEPEPELASASYDDRPVRAVRAQARYVRTSARKARLVCDHLRGKSVQEARAILAFNPRGIARDWSKVLESAVANAENNHELVAEDLIVREAFADEGPTIKRFQPRARGRASAIRKRTSHLTITLAPERR
jgi:ribosomal protein L22